MNRLRILPLFILLTLAAGCQSLVRLSGDALLYDGPGAEESCIDNTEELLENLGWEVRRAGPDYFAEYGCAGFSLVVFPGGDMYQYAADLEPNPRFNYYYGPYFIPGDDTPVVLHRYDVGDGAASLAFDYGDGRVFIIGLHPELTVVDDGDGGIDYHPDSYALMDAAVDWILEER